MRGTLEADVASTHPAAARRWSTWLVAILVVLVAGFIASYTYNTVRQRAEQRQAAIAATQGNPDAAPALFQTYGCGGCHTIPGVPAAQGLVGPELGNVARRVYVAGVVTNTPDNLIAFIVNPRSIDPLSAMPVTGIGAEDARDVAAYLYSIVP